ncbi:MAG: demethoxyubiquinone hydroxylase family protein [Sphingomonas bacterium]|nr:demethoxyubiquinone hydroxylase family protein [Sphingomonas bacterium]
MDGPATIPAASALGNLVLRVDHAGEQGAICVYRSQWAVAGLTAPSMRERLADFLVHEKRHRSIFGAALMKRGLPRGRTYALCSAGGYVLGAVTALMGRRAIAATTIALESVVMRHLGAQRAQLAATDPVVAELIASIVEDEQMQHDRSLDQIDLDRGWLRGVSLIVRQATEAAIWLGMKL